MICPQSIPVLDICVPRPSNLRRQEVLDVPSPSSPIFREVIGLDPDTTAEPSLVESVLSCSDTAKNVVFESKTVEFVPKIRSGSYADIGSRPSMDDEHIRIDDLSTQLGPRVGSFLPSSFYGVFDGHGGPEAAAYVKKNAMKLFFEDAIMPDSDDIDDVFLQNLENSHRRAFLQADLFLADERSVDSLCGTTALTALVLGRILLVANAGDCRAVLCRKGKAIEMSQDHRSSCLPERKRVEDLGGVFDEDGYLNGCLAVTRALGDWEMKPLGSQSPLIADPEIQRITLSRDDEFLIIGCDGIWDVMSNQHAVTLVRRGLRRHDDPQQCAKELAMEALRLNTSDNLTVIVVCFTTLNHNDPSSPRRSRLRCCSLSEESRNRLKRLLEGN